METKSSFNNRFTNLKRKKIINTKNNKSKNNKSKNNKSKNNKSNKKNTKKKCPDKIEFKEKKITFNYFFDKIIYENDSYTLINVTDGKNNFGIIISLSNMEKTIYFLCHTKSQILLDFEDYGISKTINPFDEESKKGKYNYVIYKSKNLMTLQNAILSKKMNLYKFKQLFKNFLKHYGDLNRRTGFKYNNFNMNSILLNNNSLVLCDFSNSTDNTKYKTVSKMKEPKTIFFDKISDYSKRDKEIMTIQKNNYDVICILLLINFCERILNPYPNEISLSQEDKQMFNSTDELFEKIRYISRMDYFKTL